MMNIEHPMSNVEVDRNRREMRALLNGMRFEYFKIRHSPFDIRI